MHRSSLSDGNEEGLTNNQGSQAEKDPVEFLAVAPLTFRPAAERRSNIAIEEVEIACSKLVDSD
jgi:hypothetical protein